MDRSVPLWLVLLLFLLGSVGAVLFGWTVKTATERSDSLSTVEKSAVQLADFPNLVDRSIREVTGLISGEAEIVAAGLYREPDVSYSDYSQVSADRIPGLLVHASGAPAGWRFVMGSFDIDGTLSDAAVLLDADLKVVWTWMLSETPIAGRTPRPSHRKFPHGVELLPDGSLIYTFDGSISLQRIDVCSAQMWAAPGNYHHSVTLSESADSVWTFDNFESLAEVSVETGEVLRSFDMADIIAANPDIDPFRIRWVWDDGTADIGEITENIRNADGQWMTDAIHFNDVDPLPTSLVDAFPQFSAGDLLVSARSLNLVFVVDPDTAKIKWWRSGATQRQHDPDWMPDGTIMVYNNRMGADYSTLLSIDPQTQARRVVLDGRDFDFYSHIRGKVQHRAEDGALVVTSPQQGRAFEVDPQGNVLFEIANTRPGDARINYVISELRWYPTQSFAPEEWTCTN